MTRNGLLTPTRQRTSMVLLALLLAASLHTMAQSSGSVVADKPLLGTGLPTLEAPRWEELSPAQQVALEPLKSRWNELGEGHRRKWVAIVKNFANLSAEDKFKVQDRMTSWASLNPAQRERARENFANSKRAAPTDKAGSWEEYLALPSEEREKLAAQASKKRPSAAKTPKPTTAKALPVPPPAPQINGSTPWIQAQQLRGNLQDWINPHTLLPISPKQ